ncbi:hypothetical protein LguiB_033619 [Lonicera macranthoides]
MMTSLRTIVIVNFISRLANLCHRRHRTPISAIIAGQSSLRFIIRKQELGIPVGPLRQMAEEAVLGFLEKNEEIIDSGQFAAEREINHDEIVNVIKSLNGFRLVDAKDIKRERWVLTDEAKKYAAEGSPEVQFLLSVPPEGISINELKGKLGNSVFAIGRAQASKNKWVEIGNDKVTKKVQHVDDKVKDLLMRIQNGEVISPEDIAALKRRKLISPQIWKGYSVTKGPKYTPKRKKAATDLTRENLQRGDWKELEFKEYNFSAKGFPGEGGHLHPLLKASTKANADDFSSDGPQQHPARDSHDTFFLKEPSTTKWLPEDYVERVKQIHESGGYGSRGYGYDWKREEANKNLLRTHTTAVSSRMLYSLAQKPFAAKKYYSVDRVFRNEAVDRTHLAEFHQIEGNFVPFERKINIHLNRFNNVHAVQPLEGLNALLSVNCPKRPGTPMYRQMKIMKSGYPYSAVAVLGLICDRGLTLGDLQGVLYDFFSRLGMSKLRFKPAYNPYTEPSMEIFGYHEGFKKWVEIGNSGMFRPEMLLPMGLPEDVRVIAWGLSLER